MQAIKFLKFGLVGTVGIAVDFSITWILREKLRRNQYFANAMGFCFACTGNYFLNRIFTFQDHNPNIGLQYLSFFVISFIGLIINSLLLLVIQKRTNLDFYYSKILVTGLLFLWNYSANSYYTFR